MGVGLAAPASLYAGGYTTTDVASVESWNGSAWTETGDLNTARKSGAAAGTQAEGLVFGGEPKTGKTEKWDGSSWTEVNDMNTTRYFVTGSGVQTQALCFGGFSGSGDLANTEVWNGTSWTELNDLSTAARAASGKNSATSALAAGGGPPATSASEEWTADNTLSTVTVS